MRKVIRAAIASASLSVLSCAGVVDNAKESAAALSVGLVPPRRPAAVDRVVLVTIDGVRWQEIFSGVDPALSGEAAPRGEAASARGLTPNLHRLFFDEGVV